MYGPDAISREDEAKIPAFTDYTKARLWFKERYGNRFILVSTENFDHGKIYFYHLILDREKYDELQEKLRNHEMVAGTEYLFSYQSIEISEDGSIHVIH